jgi:hypothetical protein
MAFTGDFSPGTIIDEAQDGMGFNIKDDSIWGAGDQAAMTLCDVYIVHIDDDEVSIAYDKYELISGADTTKFDEYLTSSGHIIDIADLTIEGVAAADVFEDGYYEITIYFSDGTYLTGDTPHYNQPNYKNTQAFLAKYRMMKRTMPATLLTWPITDAVKEKNYDIFALGLYLDAAEYAADLARKVHFRKFIALIRSIFDSYSTPEVW